MESILQAEHLIKKFADFTAVNDISFDLRAGEIFSLLGPNGAGKTTTISMLSMTRLRISSFGRLAIFRG